MFEKGLTLVITWQAFLHYRFSTEVLGCFFKPEFADLGIQGRSPLLFPTLCQPTLSQPASAVLWPRPGHLLHLPPWLWQGHGFEPSTFVLINCPGKWRNRARILLGNFVELRKLSNLSWTSPRLTGQFFWPLSQPFCRHSKMPSLPLTALTLVFIKSYLCKIAWWINRNSVNIASLATSVPPSFHVPWWRTGTSMRQPEQLSHKWHAGASSVFWAQ